MIARKPISGHNFEVELHLDNMEANHGEMQKMIMMNHEVMLKRIEELKNNNVEMMKSELRTSHEKLVKSQKYMFSMME
jgi:translation initiation factor 2B subunit (eIF-2B alpha/beta/delta family)